MYGGGSGLSARESRREQRVRERREREKLRAKLAGLPEPQFTNELEELPAEPKSSEADASAASSSGSRSKTKRKRDAAEIDAERIARENALEAARLTRPSAVKAGLHDEQVHGRRIC